MSPFYRANNARFSHLRVKCRPSTAQTATILRVFVAFCALQRRKLKQVGNFPQIMWPFYRANRTRSARFRQQCGPSTAQKPPELVYFPKSMLEFPVWAPLYGRNIDDFTCYIGCIMTVCNMCRFEHNFLQQNTT